ncbi:MAG: hypothetical protein HZB26_13140 [Candidatus Hydrogenedentes bacterium]|nr:hypothetical protein [Candidatus Hydrogenedentota bacterium]
MVILDNLESPEAVVLDNDGRIYIGSMGATSPGDDGKVLLFAGQKSAPQTLAEGLPAVEDMCIDERGDIYLAGFGSDKGRRAGIGVISKKSIQFVELKQGVQVNCLALLPTGDILYSTGRSLNTIRVLKRAAPAKKSTADGSNLIKDKAFLYDSVKF